ncbi:disease resistance protein PIK6-NP-like [Miscanthus floridulus]|uniref:disease resistance protein PIK6-NP-like n=1 Tax=Miscanthus floridulus TaxID=154761 RepID=UPI0034591CF6
MLGDLLTREYQLQASVRDDVAFLKAELESMEAALLQISEAPADRPPDAQDSLWAWEIRELSYDVEDCVEAFLVRVHHHAPAPAPPGDRDLLQGLRGLIDRGLGLLRRAKIRRDMGAEVRDIKRRVVEVGERRVRYKIDSTGETQQQSGRETKKKAKQAQEDKGAESGRTAGGAAADSAAASGRSER